MRFPILGAATMLLAFTSAALAQNPSVPLQGRPTDPNMPAPQNTVPDRIRPQEPGATGTVTEGRGTLSDKLERSDGVLRPPVDGGAGTVISPPATGSGMPIISPPASQGGTPVQPK